MIELTKYSFGRSSGYLGAGGLEKGGAFFNCTGGAARMVDVVLFGEKHIYQRPTTKAIYDTIVPFDPEGNKNRSLENVLKVTQMKFVQ